jgi:hypothetical protein
MFGNHKSSFAIPVAAGAYVVALRDNGASHNERQLIHVW